VVQLLERFADVLEPNIREWRRQSLGDLGSGLRFRYAKGSPLILPDTSDPLHMATYEADRLPRHVIPTTAQTPPEQENCKRMRV
jgi:phospholipase C